MKKIGKFDEKELVEQVLHHFAPTRKELVVGPVFGVDFAAIKCPGGFLITSSDPITGDVEDIGWYSVHVSCNDVATSGNRPEFIESVILLGESEDSSKAGFISKGIARASSELGVDVIGGHTERTFGLRHNIVVSTAFSFVKNFVTAAGSKEGDSIILTKTVGIEGTSILASLGSQKLKGLDRRVLNEAKGMSALLSVVKEAEVAFRTGGVHAMHDPTEGGLLGGLYEMSVSSGLGFEVREDVIPMAESTKKITEVFGVDPLKLIASGSMLMAVEPGRVRSVTQAIRKAGIEATVIGTFCGEMRKLISKSGKVVEVGETALDEFWRMTMEGSHLPKRR